MMGTDYAADVMVIIFLSFHFFQCTKFFEQFEQKPRSEKMPIVALSCGSDHMMMLDEMGSLFVSGVNGKMQDCDKCFSEHGQLGLSHTFGFIDWEKNMPLSSLAGDKIRYIKCGFRTSFAVTANNVAFAFGWNKYGQVCMFGGH